MTRRAAGSKVAALATAPRSALLFRLDPDALRAAAHVCGLDLVVRFGSVARGQQRAGSDLDVAIRFTGPRDGAVSLAEEARGRSAL